MKKMRNNVKATTVLKLGDYRNDKSKTFRGFTDIKAENIQIFGNFEATLSTNIIVEGNVNTSGAFEGKNIEIFGNQNSDRIFAQNYYIGGNSKIWNNLICKKTVIVAGNLKVRGKIECNLLIVKGNIEAQEIYCHGNDVYCGGRCTGILNTKGECEEILVEGGRVHENFNEWEKIASQIEMGLL